MKKPEKEPVRGIFISCPGDVTAQALQVERLFTQFKAQIPGSTVRSFLWTVDHDPTLHSSAVFTNYHVPDPASDWVDAVFVLLGNTVGTPVPPPAEGWGELAVQLEANGMGWIKLLGKDFKIVEDAYDLPEGQVPLTGTLYEYVKAWLGSDRDRRVELVRIEGETQTRPDVSDERLAKQKRWTESFVVQIAQHSTVYNFTVDDTRFEPWLLHQLEETYLPPKLDPLNEDDWPSLDPIDIRRRGALFARHDEVEKLRDWERQNPGGLKIIEGISGVGKSSLLNGGLLAEWRSAGQVQGTNIATTLLLNPRELDADLENPSDPLIGLDSYFRAAPDRSKAIRPYPFSPVSAEAPKPPALTGDAEADLMAALEWWRKHVRPRGRLILLLDQAEQIEAIAKQRAVLAAQASGQAEREPVLSEGWLRLLRLLALLLKKNMQACFPEALETAEAIRAEHPVSVMITVHRRSATELWPLALEDEGSIYKRIEPLANYDQWKEVIKGTFSAFGLSLEPKLLDKMTEECEELASASFPVSALDWPGGKRHPVAGDKPKQVSVLPQLMVAIHRMLFARKNYLKEQGESSNVTIDQLDVINFQQSASVKDAIEALGEYAATRAFHYLLENQGHKDAHSLGMLTLQSLEVQHNRRFSRLCGALIGGRDGRELIWADPSAAKLQSTHAWQQALREVRFLALATEDSQRQLRLPHRSVIDHWPRLDQWVDSNKEKLKLRAKLKNRYEDEEAGASWGREFQVQALDLYFDWMGDEKGDDGELRDWLRCQIVDYSNPHRSLLDAKHPTALVAANAIQQQDIDLIEQLLACSKWTETDQFRCEWVLMLSSGGHVNSLKKLLKCYEPEKEKIDPVNFQDTRSGDFPLLLSASNGYIETVRLLLRYGADPNKIDSKNAAFPLFLAAIGGHVKIVERLLKERIDIDRVQPYSGYTSLAAAVANNCAETACQLIRGGARVDCVNKLNGTFPLLVASQLGMTTTVEALLNAGANPNKANTKDGITPLLLAADNSRIVELLIRKNVNVEKENAVNGDFPLLLAAAHGAVESIDMILKAGADPSRYSVKSGVSPLLLACEHQDFAVVSLLLNKGADPNYVNFTSGSFPMLVASIKDSLNVAAKLYDAGADLDKVCKFHGTFPLLFAAELGNIEVLDFLLDNGAKINAVNPVNGTYPLFSAVYTGSLSAVKKLVKHGARGDSKVALDGIKCTALDAAIIGNRYEIAEFLLEHDFSLSAIRNIRNLELGERLPLLAKLGFKRLYRELVKLGASQKVPYGVLLLAAEVEPVVLSEQKWVPVDSQVLALIEPVAVALSLRFLRVEISEPWLDDLRLLRQYVKWKGQEYFVYFLISSDHCLPLTGSGAVFAAFYDEQAWSTVSDEVKKRWLLLQVACSTSAEGLFYPIRSIADLPQALQSAITEEQSAAITPPAWQGEVLHTVILYKSRLSKAQFRLGASGTVEMLGDELICTLDGVELMPPLVLEPEADPRETEVQALPSAPSDEFPRSVIPGDWQPMSVETVSSQLSAAWRALLQGGIEFVQLEALQLEQGVSLLRLGGKLQQADNRYAVELLGLQYNERIGFAKGSVELVPGFELLALLKDLRPELRSVEAAKAWVALALQLQGCTALAEGDEWPLAEGTEPPRVPYEGNSWREWMLRRSPKGGYVTMPWTMGDKLYLGQVSTPHDGVGEQEQGIAPLQGAEVLAQGVAFKTPQVVLGPDEKVLPFWVWPV